MRLRWYYIIPVFLLFLTSCDRLEEANNWLSSLKKTIMGKYQGHPPSVIVRPLFPSDLFWFELNSKGPLLISAPEQASLCPFAPWTQSLHITTLMPAVAIAGSGGTANNGALYAGINHWGILQFEAQDEETALYYYRGGEAWENYPILALFQYGDRPAAFLGRDRFFGNAMQPTPDSPFWIIDNKAGLIPSALPALDSFPTAKGWETAALFQSENGIWYFHLLLPEQHNIFLTTDNLSLPARQIDGGAFALMQEEFSYTPPPMVAWVMSEAERLMECSSMTLIVSPEFSGKRLFRTGSAAGEMEFFGYYRSPLAEIGGAAIIALPDGRGIYCFAGGGVQKDGHFRLPPMGGSFVYTGIALVGKDILIASWEEQAEWNVGAAGFLIQKTLW
jgi:hypothetical protein